MFKVSVNLTDREMSGRLSLVAGKPLLKGLLMCKMNHRFSNKELIMVDLREGGSKQERVSIRVQVVQVSNNDL